MTLIIAACPSCGWTQPTETLWLGHLAATDHNAFCPVQHPTPRPAKRRPRREEQADVD